MTRLTCGVTSLFVVLLLTGLTKEPNHFLRHSSLFCLTREDHIPNVFFDGQKTSITNTTRITIKISREDTTGSAYKCPSNSGFFSLAASMYRGTLSSDVEISLTDVIRNSSVHDSELEISWMNDVGHSSVRDSEHLTIMKTVRAVWVRNSSVRDSELPLLTI